MEVSDRVATGLKATLVARVLRIAASGLLTVLLARFLLEPDEYGLLFLAISVLGVTQFFADLGLAKACARYVTTYRESDPAQVPHILRTTLTYRLALIGVVSLALVAASGTIASAIGEPDLAPLLVVGAAYIAAKSMQAFTSTVFQGFNRVTWSALVTTVTHVGRLLFVVAFVLLGAGVVGALLGYVVASAAAGGVGLYVLYTRFYSQYDAADAMEPDLPRRIAEYSVPLTFTRSASILDRRVDTILVGLFLNTTAVGFYTLGKQISTFLTVPAGSLGFTISPTYGEQQANDELREAARTYEATMRYTLLLYVPAAVGVVLVAEPAITLIFGSAYAGAVPVIQLFSVFVLCSSVISITTDGLDYLGHARSRAIAKGTTSVANFGLNLVLIPSMGVVGAALATVLTFGAYTLLNVYVMVRELPIALGRLTRSIAITCAIAACMGVAVLVVTPYISGLLTLFGAIALGVAIWGVLATASGQLDVQRVVSILA